MTTENTAYSILVNGTEYTIGDKVRIGRNKTTWQIAYFHNNQKGVTLHNPTSGRNRDAAITELKKA